MRAVNGHWYIRFRHDGVEYNAPTGLEATEQNRAKALKLEAQKRAAVEAGQSIKIRSVPFSKAMEAFLDWAQGEYVKKSSFAHIRSALSFAVVHFAGQPVSRITAGAIEAFKQIRRADGIKEVSLRHNLHALSLFFQYCKKQSWCSGNPVERVEMPSDAGAVRINPLSAAQEQLYVETCRRLDAELRVSKKVRYWSDAAYLDLADFARLIIELGCRPGELLALRKSDVDVLGRNLTVRAGKTSSARRRLWLTASAMEILTKRLQVPGPWVFPSPWDCSKRRTTFQRVHDQVMAAIAEQSAPGAPSLSCVIYDFRHTFATRAAAAGMPLPVLSKALGHSPSNLRTVAHYVHMSADDVAREMERIEKAASVKNVAKAVVSETILSTVKEIDTAW